MAITVLLGLGIFAVMPRFPGYQFQNMPVSSPSPGTEEQGFDGENQGISNPGYVSPGTENGENGSGGNGDGDQEGSPTSGPGQMNAEFYYGFNSVMNQNLRGSMEKKLLLRVRSQAPGFLRVMGFDRYTGEGWEQTKEEEVSTIKRPPWSYRFLLNPPPPPIPKKLFKPTPQLRIL
ncbi:MAG: hypothetical protein HC796_10930 [Synechococcaceae cyanobacterium RL_1_2]|nr:hypothetical protein [Synechococcaceae cyanobacterium RL_1_2]